MIIAEDMMHLPQALSVLVYLASAIVFTAALLVVLRGKSRWVKGCALSLTYACIGFVAVLEFPITQMPFWSRDFSLTWTMMVLACAIGVVCLRPWIVAFWEARRQPRRYLSGPSRPSTEDQTEAATSRDKPFAQAQPQVTPPQPMLLSRGRSVRRSVWVLLAIAVGVGLAIVYWRGAQQNLIRVNTDPGQRDQNAYIGYAEDLLNEDYSHVGNRNRMPVYSFLLSFALNPAELREVAFVRAKYFSVGLSLALLAAIGALFFRSFSPLEASTLLLITAFALYIFRAAYVQPELLYYTLVAFLFVSMLRYLTRPSIGLAVAIGVLAGLAHLTKASVLPGLVLFLLVAFGWGLGRALRDARRTRGVPIESFSHAVNLALVVGFFLLTVFPYIKNSWYRFGRPFYNVNSTFYVWYDTWEEVERGTKTQGDRSGWPDMPASQIPSYGKYIREHTPGDMVGRLLHGASLTIDEAVGSYGYAKYIVLFSLALLLALGLNRRRLGDGFRRYPQVAIFLIVYFVAYAVLYAWFAQIVDGNRLVLALLAPLLLSLAYGIRFALHDRNFECLGRRVSLLNLVYALFLVVVVLDIRAVTTYRILSMFGGS